LSELYFVLTQLQTYTIRKHITHPRWHNYSNFHHQFLQHLSTIKGHPHCMSLWHMSAVYDNQFQVIASIGIRSFPLQKQYKNCVLERATIWG